LGLILDYAAMPLAGTGLMTVEFSLCFGSILRPIAPLYGYPAHYACTTGPMGYTSVQADFGAQSSDPNIIK
jgi:hypothetical protein